LQAVIWKHLRAPFGNKFCFENFKAKFLSAQGSTMYDLHLIQAKKIQNCRTLWLISGKLLQVGQHPRSEIWLHPKLGSYDILDVKIGLKIFFWP